MLIVFIRGIMVYFLVIFATRVMGKRQLGELSPSELVITILISNIATLAMEDPEASLITGVVPILTLVCLDILASFAALKSRKLRHVISGRPKVIISNGKLDQAVMKELRFTVDDVCSALRNSGVFDIDEVQYAVVETTGTISVLLKANNRPVTPETLTAPETSSDPPQVLISDGDIIGSGMNGAGLDEKELRKELKRKHLDPSDVLLCMMRPDNSLYIIPKEK
ncbi:MAG: DUF421 domain-containing protein [Oscillospiraceae bacterium]|nr:DUF421 domain-containing protein [Oscillospiraceae bacterium]